MGRAGLGSASRGRRRRGAALAVALALVAVFGAALASAERHQEGNLIASLAARVSPRKLPRHRLAPISVHISGSLRTADRSTLPRVTTLELALAGTGAIDTRGLPACPAPRLRYTRDREALAVCGAALVGHGSLEAEVLLPGQGQFSVHSRLLVFNGRAAGGGTVLLLHGFALDPPTAVVVPFRLRHRRGRFPNALVATLPHALGRWPRVASFEMTLSRRFSYRGARHSLLTASCPVPPRFTMGFLSVARISFGIAGGGGVATEIVRACHAR